MPHNRAALTMDQHKADGGIVKRQCAGPTKGGLMNQQHAAVLQGKRDFQHEQALVQQIIRACTIQNAAIRQARSSPLREVAARAALGRPQSSPARAAGKPHHGALRVW